MVSDEIKNRFIYHAPKDGQPIIYTQIRDKAFELVSMVVELTPESREQSLAITKIEEAVMWANAGLARRS